MVVEFVHGSHDAILKFLFGCDPDVTQHRASELGKETFDQVEPGAMLGRKGKFEAASGLIGEPAFGLLGDVGGMIVEDYLDRRFCRIGGIDKLEKFDEFATAVAVLDNGMNLPGEQIDAGQQSDRAVSLVLMVASEGRTDAGFGRQV